MNNPNPFVPKGSLLEQHKRRSRMKLAVFCIVAISVASLTTMLIEGCKRENENSDANSQPTAEDTNQAPLEASNPPVVVPPISTNAPASTNVMPPAPVVTAPTPVTAPEETSASTYVVVKGDTLGKIAKANGVSLRALESANPDVQPTRLKIGEKLNIPASTSGSAASPEASGSTDTSGGAVYVVKSGDTLSKIARRNGTTVKAIESANNLTTTKIKVGQKLTIPASASTSASAPAAPEPAPAPAPMVPAPAPSTPAPGPTTQQ
jgi:LysM repeat protein